MAANKIKPKATTETIPIEPVSTEQENNVQEEVTTVAVADEENTSPVVMVDTEDKQPPEKNVKVCLKVNHTCNIGGETYHFEKGKQVNVPASVKTILMQADLLMPL